MYVDFTLNLSINSIGFQYKKVIINHYHLIIITTSKREELVNTYHNFKSTCMNCTHKKVERES